MRDRVEGVCAFIPHPTNPGEQFLVLRENEWKRLTNKVPGMLAPVIETVDPGETHQQALTRAIYEELSQKLYTGLFPDKQEELNRQKLCEVQLSDNAWLIAYLLEAKNGNFYYDLAKATQRFQGVVPARVVDFTEGSPLYLTITRDEVEPVGWANFADVLESETEVDRYRFAYRPGVFEIVKSYCTKLKNPTYFLPGIYPNPINPVPSELFDILDGEGVEHAGKFSVDDNDPSSLFHEIRVARAMRQLNLDPTSYLQRLIEYAQQIYGLELAPYIDRELKAS